MCALARRRTCPNEGQTCRDAVGQPSAARIGQDWGVAQLKTVIPVWVLVTVCAVLIGLLSPVDEYLTWLAIALVAGILLTFCLQLAIVRKQGLVTRVMVSLGGSVVILGLATAILSLIASSAG